MTKLKTYSPEAKRILAKIRQEAHVKKQKGYSRQQAFEDILEAQMEIADQLRKFDSSIEST